MREGQNFASPEYCPGERVAVKARISQFVVKLIVLIALLTTENSGHLNMVYPKPETNSYMASSHLKIKWLECEFLPFWGFRGRKISQVL